MEKSSICHPISFLLDINILLKQIASDRNILMPKISHSTFEHCLRTTLYINVQRYGLSISADFKKMTAYHFTRRMSIFAIIIKKSLRFVYYITSVQRFSFRHHLLTLVSGVKYEELTDSWHGTPDIGTANAFRFSD